MSEKIKKRRGDRSDARLVRDCDSMHIMMPYMMPGRVANEAVLTETIDLSAIERYIERRNSESPEYKYTFFHVICAALGKTVYQRPKMNRFYAGNNRYYERNDISFSFVVKKYFKDDSHEALAIIKMDRDSGESPIEQMHGKITRFAHSVREEKVTDDTTDVIDKLTKAPGWLLKLIMNAIRALDKRGKLFKSLTSVDPYNSTVFVTNLGSIKMKANYHHLADWGTNSFFVCIGEKHPEPFFNADGTYELRDVLELGMTIDERIADGLYFAGSLKLLRYLFAHPELLELPLETVVEPE